MLVRRLVIATVIAGAFMSCKDYPAIYDPPDGSHPAGDAGPDAGPDAGDAGPPAPGCVAGTQYVYTFAADESIYSFNPPTLSFVQVGMLECPTEAEPYSMAVDEEGHAWVEYTDGTIYQVNIDAHTCTATPFVPDQNGFFNFGMGFSADGDGGTTETLYVSDSDGKGLASVDTNTLILSPIGPYMGLPMGLSGRAELTGTGDGRLYGGFEGDPFVLAQIDKTNAQILSSVELTPIRSGFGGSNFAFAAWGGQFWFFSGPGTFTDVYMYDPDAGTTTLQTTTPLEIVGAGVSVCAGQTASPADTGPTVPAGDD